VAGDGIVRLSGGCSATAPGQVLGIGDRKNQRGSRGAGRYDKLSPAAAIQPKPGGTEAPNGLGKRASVEPEAAQQTRVRDPGGHRRTTMRK